MKKLFVICFMMFFAFNLQTSYADQEEILSIHRDVIYPVVRVVTSTNSAGSGTVLYSQLNREGKYSTYILTNYHVIDSAVSINDEWDSALGKNVKKESRAILYVEIFKYKNISTPVGTMKIEADIIIYNEKEDMALLKLRSEEQVVNIVKIIPRNKTDEFYVMDNSIAVGCSLAFPPLPTTGIITRKNVQINSLNFHMSSSQIIYGNSGGGMFLLSERGIELIGIPSLVVTTGWFGSTPITHMGLFIPIERIYTWLEKEYYDFVFNKDKNEFDSLKLRKEEIAKKKENK